MAAHGCSQAMLLFFESGAIGAPESRLHLQAFIRNWAAKPKIPGLDRGPPSAIPKTHCAVIKKGTGARIRGYPCRICVNEMTG